MALNFMTMTRIIKILVILVLTMNVLALVSLSCSGQIIVTATIYNAVPSQTDSDPLITASLKEINPVNPQRWIAVSRDLEQMGITLGSKVCIENAGEMNGEWVVEDRMNKRWRRRIDFLVHDSIRLGKWNNVKITIK